MSASAGEHLRSCPCCGLVLRIPPIPPRMRACCTRCNATLREHSRVLRGNSRAAAIALAALILYPMAVSLPMIRVERFGHTHESSILEGTYTLLTTGHVVVGLIVFVCSIVLPIGKLASLLVLSAGGMLMRHEHRALTFRVVEFTGRWGMLDVLLVAVLVAALKIGDLVEVTAGPAALAFTSCVVLSLLATAAFDPHSLWPPNAPINGGTSHARESIRTDAG
ncbi:MAG: paraquat-inducible protein A [Phycisphaerae bacterium]|nr:paraquat-inducible protein A [Phycisphaerae bacterium]